MKKLKKAWGGELWIVNCPEYCGKLLYLDKGAESSIHYHMKKQETFFCLAGLVSLTLNKGIGHPDITRKLHPFGRPVTIKPEQRHSFLGLENSTILEVSTHHNDKDVHRLRLSKGVPCGP